MHVQRGQIGADTFLPGAFETGAGARTGASLNTSLGAPSFESGGDIDAPSESYWERGSFILNVATERNTIGTTERFTSAGWDSIGKENIREGCMHRESTGKFEHGTDYSSMNSLLSPKTDHSSKACLSGSDEKQAQLFHAQLELLRDQITVLTRDLVQVRNEIHNIRISESTLRRDLETETTHRQELAARHEASVKAVATEADTVCRCLQTEVAGCIVAQESTLRDIVHQSADIIYQVDACRTELKSDCGRLRSQVMDLIDVVDSERKLHAVIADGLRLELTELWGLLETEVKNRSAVDVEVNKALKVLTLDHIARYSSMKQVQQDFDDKLEGETQARMADDAQNRKALKEAVDLFKHELLNESTGQDNVVLGLLNKLVE